MRFGEYLVQQNYISQENLDYALKAQSLLSREDSKSLPIGEVAHELGMINKKILEKALKEFLSDKD